MKDKKEKGLSDEELVKKYESGKIDLGKKLKKGINKYHGTTKKSKGSEDK